MEPKDRRFEKGFFTPSRFAMSAKYQALTSRKSLFLLGTLTGLGFVILFLADAIVGRAATVTGRLTESHALFAKDCSSCHTPGKGVANANCLSCHQKSGGDAGTFSFARHYEYHSGLVDRSAPRDKEPSCASCHREHKGRDALLQRTANGACVTCHDVGSFARASGHPEFEFAAKKLADPANLKFPHIIHVREVMERDSLQEAERSCITCHVPNADGRFFQPLSYAKSCDGCHLGEDERTPLLPTRSGNSPGVVTIEEIKRSGGPGTQWAEHWNSDEMLFQGGQLRKRPVYHADPWVLENLRRLRRELYPGAELADLLRVAPGTSAREARELHEEALQTLQTQLESVRGNPSPDVQREVSQLSAVIREIERRIDEPYAPLDESKFGVTEGDRDPSRDPRAYGAVVDSLTKPCQSCHLVENATIQRVQTDQRSLVRAQFNHRAHVTHKRCLDCHNVIPIRDFLTSGDDPPPERDRAEILNLPSIATCRSCHVGSSASTRCVSCHSFHPDKSYQSNLVR